MRIGEIVLQRRQGALNDSKAAWDTSYVSTFEVNIAVLDRRNK